MPGAPAWYSEDETGAPAGPSAETGGHCRGEVVDVGDESLSVRYVNMAAKGFVTDNFLIGGQIYDGNAASGEFDLDTFEEHEWLKAVEIAWTPSVSRYKTDRIQLTYWDKDESDKAGLPKGSGWAVSASWQLTDRLIPFTRFGHSDGGAGVAAESAASIGFEFAPRNDQTWSLGAGWGDHAGGQADGAPLGDLADLVDGADVRVIE